MSNLLGSPPRIRDRARMEPFCSSMIFPKAGSRFSGSCPRAVQRFLESPNRSKYLFLRNSGRKTVTHFSWNCSSVSARPWCRRA
ncbi:MAG: hypothetical protein E5V61_21885, partial [Mesorhizobium sp.]